MEFEREVRIFRLPFQTAESRVTGSANPDSTPVVTRWREHVETCLSPLDKQEAKQLTRGLRTWQILQRSLNDPLTPTTTNTTTLALCSISYGFQNIPQMFYHLGTKLEYMSLWSTLHIQTKQDNVFCWFYSYCFCFVL